MMEQFIQKRKKYITAMLALALTASFGFEATASAASQDGAINKASTQKRLKLSQNGPVKITGDELTYGYEDGEVSAKGNVIVIDGSQVIETDYFHGNNKKQMYYAPNTLTYESSTVDVKGNDLIYNGILKEGIIGRGEGFFSNKYYIRGKDIVLSTDPDRQKGTIEVGMITTKHAMAWKNPPDYRIEGEEIVVVPNKYISIKEARLYIRNWHAMTLKSYTSKIGSSAKQQGSSLFSIIPQPYYSSNDGFALRASINQPIGENGMAFFKYRWYNKSGFKPNIGYRYALPWGDATIAYSKEKNSEHDYWITKRPEFRIATKAYPIGSDKLKLNGEFTLGKWIEGDTTGSHHMEKVELNYGPIPFSKKIRTYATTGFQRDYYSYDGTLRNNFYWNVRGEYDLSSRFSTYVGYYDNKHENDSPYRFDRIDDNNYLLYGATWQVDRMNAIGVGYKYSFNRHEVTQQKIHYTRDLHSMLARFSYDVKDHDFTFKLDFKDFDFTI